MVYIKKTTKTQKKFEDSLLQLMKLKKFETITVNDITELADVNRSTFYRHYLDKYELLEKIEDNILSEVINFHSTFISRLPNFKIDNSFKIEDYISVDNNFFNVFEKHLETMAILMGGNGSITFQNKLNSTMLSIFEKTFSINSLKLTKIERDLLYNFQSSSFISILCYWTEHPQLTVQELFSFYSKIISNGIVNFVKEKMI
ncbi:TetR/AcrR family transcriptional regulator C-terminal domain-containing protein [Gemella sanguinis]